MSFFENQNHETSSYKKEFFYLENDHHKNIVRIFRCREIHKSIIFYYEINIDDFNLNKKN